MKDPLTIKVFPKEADAKRYTGAHGEITYDKETCKLRLHDGCCCGGKALGEDFDATDILARLDALEDLNPIIDLEIDENGDYTATYLDGTQELLDDVDIPTISVTNNGADSTLVVNGVAVGVFDNPPENLDTNTTYTFVTNPNGSITVTGSDGSAFTSIPAVVDTDTFATLAGQTITFANGDMLTVGGFTSLLYAVQAGASITLVGGEPQINAATITEMKAPPSRDFGDLLNKPIDNDVHAMYHKKYAFRATNANMVMVPSGIGVANARELILSSIDYDRSEGAYNGTGRYTAPVKGLYQFNGVNYISNDGGVDELPIRTFFGEWMVNNVTIARVGTIQTTDNAEEGPDLQFFMLNDTIQLELDAGDEVWMRVRQLSGEEKILNSTLNSFAGRLIECYPA